MRQLTDRGQKSTGELSGRLGELFNFIKTVKASGVEVQELQKFNRANHNIEKNWQHVCWCNALNFPILEIAAGIILSGILLYGVFFIKTGKLTVGGFIAFLGTLLFLYESIKRLFYTVSVVQEIQTIFVRIQSLLSSSVNYGYQQSHPLTIADNYGIEPDFP